MFLVQAFFFPPLKNSRLLCGKGWKAVNKNQEGFVSGHSGCWRSYGLDLDKMDISWIPNLLCRDTFAWGKYFVHIVSSNFHVFKNNTLESFTVQHLAIGISISVFWFTWSFEIYFLHWLYSPFFWVVAYRIVGLDPRKGTYEHESLETISL